MTHRLADLLVIEDDPHDAALIREALRAMGADSRVDFVEDGADALDYLFRKGAYSRREADAVPRALVLDLKLPRVDGREIIRRMRAEPGFAGVVIVVLSSSSEPADIHDCYRLGANSFIVKPPRADQFSEVIVKILDYWLTINEFD